MNSPPTFKPVESADLPVERDAGLESVFVPDLGPGVPGPADVEVVVPAVGVRAEVLADPGLRLASAGHPADPGYMAVLSSNTVPLRPACSSSSPGLNRFRP